MRSAGAGRQSGFAGDQERKNQHRLSNKYAGTESAVKLKQKHKQLQDEALERELMTKKKWWQYVIFVISFLANFSIQYDIDVCVVIQTSIKGDDALPQVQFVRLTCAIGVIALGLMIEQMTDQQAKRMIFLMMTMFCCWKLYHEILIFSNPIKNHLENLTGVNKLGQAILLALNKVFYVTQIIVMAKWFSRKWFPFFVSLWCLSANLSEFLKKAITCAAREDSEHNPVLDIECSRQAAAYGILSCVVTFVIALFVLNFYSIDPLDKDLLINEQAKYLTSTTSQYNEVKDIASVSRFLQEFHEKHERDEMARKQRQDKDSDQPLGHIYNGQISVRSSMQSMNRGAPSDQFLSAGNNTLRGVSSGGLNSRSFGRMHPDDLRY